MTAATLEAVLADHDWLTPRGYAWPCCTCGVEFPGGEDDAFAHVAAAVRSWLADRLADEGLREAVAEAVGDVWLDGGHGLGCECRDEPHDITATKATTAALAAVTAAPTEGAGDE